MIITYALGKGYTIYDTPLGNTLTFRQLIGYHPTKQDARLALTFKVRSYDHVGTITGRWSSSRPELQDPNHRQGPKGPMMSVDFTEVEKRTLAHYSQGMTATQAAEARDKFDEAYPKVEAFWEDVKPDYIAKLKARTDGMDARTFRSLYMQEPLLPVGDLKDLEGHKFIGKVVRDQRKPAAGRRGLYTEDQREALRSKASQRRPKKS